jgi:predicted DCC family thiol-disulfide oxidoreductase YuxK
MPKLYVLYDARCDLCDRLKNWLLEQSCWLEMETIPAGSELARQMFPGLERIASSDDLVVISDDGSVYLNNHAWIMCLYALEEYRSWSYRLAHPLLLPLVRQAFTSLSKNRYTISRWLGTGNPENIAKELRQITLEPCQPEGTVSDYLR